MGGQDEQVVHAGAVQRWGLHLGTQSRVLKGQRMRAADDEEIGILSVDPVSPVGPAGCEPDLCPCSCLSPTLQTYISRVKLCV